MVGDGDHQCLKVPSNSNGGRQNFFQQNGKKKAKAIFMLQKFYFAKNFYLSKFYLQTAIGYCLLQKFYQNEAITCDRISLLKLVVFLIFCRTVHILYVTNQIPFVVFCKILLLFILFLDTISIILGIDHK